MSGTGTVDLVFGAQVPNTGRPARMVLVNLPAGGQVQFAIPPGGPEPAVGETINWGPHHAWWAAHRVDKLTWELDPNAVQH